MIVHFIVFLIIVPGYYYLFTRNVSLVEVVIPEEVMVAMRAEALMKDVILNDIL